MPKALKKKLYKRAKKKFPKDKKLQDRYVYGTLNNVWKYLQYDIQRILDY